MALTSATTRRKEARLMSNLISKIRKWLGLDKDEPKNS